MRSLLIIGLIDEIEKPDYPNLYLSKAYCYNCYSQKHEWIDLSGNGTVYSFTVVHQSLVPGFRHDLPFIISIIEPVDAPNVRIMSNIVDCKPEMVYIGMPVEVTYEDRGKEITLPMFRPVGREATNERPAS